MTEGLKEALKVGVENAVKKVGITDGYYKNLDIKILMPKNMKQAKEYLDQLGLEKYTEDLVKKMNRAAETAAPKAQEIFIDAMKKMKFEDAAKILSGKDTEATDYLQNKTTDSLKKEFYPIVKDNMEKVGAIKAFNDFVKKYESNPLLEKIDLDINNYVTEEAIQGLFKMVAEEEKKIRNDPQARINDILKDVFGEFMK